MHELCISDKPAPRRCGSDSVILALPPGWCIMLQCKNKQKLNMSNLLSSAWNKKMQLVSSVFCRTVALSCSSENFWCRWEWPCKEWAPFTRPCLCSVWHGRASKLCAHWLSAGFFRGAVWKAADILTAWNQLISGSRASLLFCWQIRQATEPPGPMGHNCLDVLMWCASCDEDFFLAFKLRGWTGRLQKKQGDAGPKHWEWVEKS